MIKPDCYYAWNYRGVVLNKLGRYEEALQSFEKSLNHKHQNPNAWYGKASTYALCGQVNLALSNLRRAIELSPNLYRVMVQTDASFNSLRQHPSFQELLL
jgi:superkiller protein 3